MLRQAGLASLEVQMVSGESPNSAAAVLFQSAGVSVPANSARQPVAVRAVAQ